MMDNSVNEEREDSGGGFDFARFIKKLIRNYYWIILTVILSGVAVKFYLRYQVPLHKVSTYILMAGVGQNDATAILSGAGLITGNKADSKGNSDISNEIFILQSGALMRKVVDSLSLDVELTSFGRIKDVPANVDSLPFTVTVRKPYPDHESPQYKFILAENSYSFQNEKRKFQGYYGQPLIVNNDTFLVVLKNQIGNNKFREYGIRLESVSKTVKKYVERLTVYPVPKAGLGTLQVSMEDEIPERANKIITVLIDKYNFRDQTFKNHSIRSALEFLNNRVSSVYDDLQKQETEVSNFKRDNRLTNVSTSADQLLTNLTELDAQQGQNEYKKTLLELVENNIKSYNTKEEIVPNAAGLADPVLAGMIGQYNQLVQEKRLILDQGTPNDLRLLPINGQLEEIRNNILKNITNIRNEIRANENFLAGQEQRIAGRFSTLPGKEQEFVQMERASGIKEALYTYLLQKREETELQLVSADVAKFRIVDTGIYGGIVQPVAKNYYLIALAVGIMLPSLIILIKFLSNRRIETRKEIEKGTPLAIAGEISYAKKMKDVIVTKEGNRTAIAEQFRALRTNLSYLAHGSSQKVILITSSTSGEGKSFLSLNLANSIATSNKKVVLIELDLRKPKLSSKLELGATIGISEYLANQSQPVEIIQTLEGYKNLYFISSGAIPPNPAELVLNNRLAELITYLKQNFDTVIIDSPPVGLVSETITMGKLADITLFVIRHKYSLQSSLKLVNDLSAKKKLPHMSVVINGISTGKGGGYGDEYGYEYGYGYSNGNGYLEDPEESSKKTKFWKRKTADN